MEELERGGINTEGQMSDRLRQSVSAGRRPESWQKPVCWMHVTYKNGPCHLRLENLEF